jgi:hypothetical protein
MRYGSVPKVAKVRPKSLQLSPVRTPNARAKPTGSLFSFQIAIAVDARERSSYLTHTVCGIFQILLSIFPAVSKYHPLLEEHNRWTRRQKSFGQTSCKIDRYLLRFGDWPATSYISLFQAEKRGINATDQTVDSSLLQLPAESMRHCR